MTTTLLRSAVLFALVVGLLDFATGIALTSAPAFTLAQMGAAVPGREALLYVRFAGVFVASVGASYLWAVSSGSVTCLRAALQITLLFRLAAGSFSGVAVAMGFFDRAWLGVTLTDLTCVAVQAWFLAKGLGRDD